MRRRTCGRMPDVEALGGRRLLSGPGTVAPVLAAFADAYPSARGDPRFNPSADANGNGIVAMGDATLILPRLAPSTPKVPLRLTLALGPGQQVLGHHPANSGGVTRDTEVTIEGKTTPNSLVFTDDANNDFRFKGGGAIAVDSAGNFSIRVRLTGNVAVSQHNFRVLDPFGHALNRAFPILRLLR